jgi:hypothetical protein
MPSRHIGGRALWLASRTDELMSRITRSPPRLPVWLADFMRSGASMDNSKSVQELGIAYRPISESIEAAIDWFRDAGLFEGPEPTPFEHDGIRSRAENPRVGGPSAGSFNRRFLGWAAETGDRRPKPPEGPA